MDAGYLDQLVQAYVAAFQRGFSLLHSISLGLLGILGGIAWGATFITTIHAGLPIGSILAHLCMVLLSLAIHVWLITNMYEIALGVFTMFAGWGAQVTGGTFSAAQFLSPSTVWTMGFTIAQPFIDFVMNISPWGIVKNLPPLFIMLFGVVVLIGVFLWVAKDVIMTILEFHLAVLVAPVLFPWAILSHTAEFAAFVISWLMAVCIRALLIIATIGTGAPLVATLLPTFTAGGDPTIYSSLVVLGVAVMFLLIVNEVVKRASTVGGRGYALGLPGASFIPASVSAASGMLLGGAKGAVITSATRIMQARRGG